MKRTIMRILLLVCFTISITGAFAFTGEPGPTNFASPAEARAIIQKIMDAVGMKTTFDVRAANIPNAAAATFQNKRYILYNPVFLAAIQKATGNNWVPISILAHEIGHHVNGHTLGHTVNDPTQELEADIFSGFVLRRMGATLDDAQLAMRVAASATATATHPGRTARLDAIEQGWDKADEQLAGTDDVPRHRDIALKNTSDETATQAAASELDARYIAFDVHFNSDPKGTYLVTVRNNLVKLGGNGFLIFGKMLATNDSDFPLALTAGKNVLLVNRKGQLMSVEGENVGYVTAHDASN